MDEIIGEPKFASVMPRSATTCAEQNATSRHRRRNASEGAREARARLLLFELEVDDGLLIGDGKRVGAESVERAGARVHGVSIVQDGALLRARGLAASTLAGTLVGTLGSLTNTSIAAR